jgi:L-cysteine/cystine lyase
MKVVKPEARLYFNHGKYGFNPFYTAYEDGYEALYEARWQVRQILGKYFDIPTDEIAIVSSTAEAANILTWGIDWREGDEVVTTSLEHPSILAPLWAISQRYGVKIIQVDIGYGEKQSDILKHITDRTRLCFMSSVAYSTGALLSVYGLADIIRETNSATLIFIDAAQHFAPKPLFTFNDNLFDAISCSGHKWLTGPMGTGFFWISGQTMEKLRPTFVSSWSVDYEAAERGNFVLNQGASRYDYTNASVLALKFWSSSLVEFLPSLAINSYHAYQLATIFVNCIAKNDRCRVITPERQRWHIVCLQMNGLPGQQVCQALAQRGIDVRAIQKFDCVRFCFHSENTESEVVEAVRIISEI